MSTKLRTIFAAPGGGWGGLFTQEERERECRYCRLLDIELVSE